MPGGVDSRPFRASWPAPARAKQPSKGPSGGLYFHGRRGISAESGQNQLMTIAKTVAKFASLVLVLTGGFAALGTPGVAQDRRVPASPAELKLSFAPVVQRTSAAVVNVYAAKMVQN